MNLRFDTEQGRETAATLMRCAGNIQSELGTASSSAETLAGAWEAPAANQFQEQFQSWSGQVRQAIETLEALKARLDQEIEQWETTAANM